MHLLRFLERADAEQAPVRTPRRAFLGLAGVSTLALAACDSNDDDGGADVTLDFSTDFGVLNYAYALEQLEAAFYTQVVATPYSGMNSDEMAIFADLKAHEVIHRDFFKAALGMNAIGSLVPDFSAVNFSNRTSVLTTSKTFEDLGVSAYNGAGKYLRDPGFLLLAGKIVSVEARHAAVIRGLISGRQSDAFANVSDLSNLGANNANGLDGAAEPRTVLAAADPFIKTSISLRNVPS
jgi:hypothetical protein